MIYSSWDIECDRPKLVIMGPFLPSPLKTKNQNFEKMKEIAEDIIILYKRTKNHNHLRYGSWDIEWERHNLLTFWVIFRPFTPLTTQKTNILKKWKQHLETFSFYTCVSKSQSYHVCFLRYGVQQTEFFLILGHFCPF